MWRNARNVVRKLWPAKSCLVGFPKSASRRQEMRLVCLVVELRQPACRCKASVGYQGGAGYVGEVVGAVGEDQTGPVLRV